MTYWVPVQQQHVSYQRVQINLVVRSLPLWLHGRLIPILWIFFITPLPNGLDCRGEETIAPCWSGWHSTPLGPMSLGVNWMTKSKDIIWLQATMIHYMSCVLLFTDKNLVPQNNKFADHNCIFHSGNCVHRHNVDESSSTKFSFKKVVNTLGQFKSSQNHGVASLVLVFHCSCW